MAPNIRETYLAAEVYSAPPQKLQLMLIEGALRLAYQAEQHWKAGKIPAANQALNACQRIVFEVLSKLRPEMMPDLVSRVAGIYMFVHRSLAAAKQNRDPGKLADVLKVLEAERENWRQICQAMAATAESSEPSQRLALEA